MVTLPRKYSVSMQNIHSITFFNELHVSNAVVKCFPWDLPQYTVLDHRNLWSARCQLHRPDLCQCCIPCHCQLEVGDTEEGVKRDGEEMPSNDCS